MSKQTTIKKKKECFLCVNSLDIIDYKNTTLLKKFTSSYAKILPRRRSGACAKHQRRLNQSIKRARFMALLPYTNR